MSTQGLRRVTNDSCVIFRLRNICLDDDTNFRNFATLVWGGRIIFNYFQLFKSILFVLIEFHCTFSIIVKYYNVMFISILSLPPMGSVWIKG